MDAPPVTHYKLGRRPACQTAGRFSQIHADINNLYILNPKNLRSSASKKEIPIQLNHLISIGWDYIPPLKSLRVSEQLWVSSIALRDKAHQKTRIQGDCQIIIY